jgi:hypothetical protein
MNSNPIKKGVVYILSDGEFLKIGMTKNVNQRLSSLQTGNPKDIKIVNTFETDNMPLCEKVLQSKFSNYSVKNEWFSIPNDNPYLMRLMSRKGQFFNGVLFHEGMFVFDAKTRKGKNWIDKMVAPLFLSLVINETEFLNEKVNVVKKSNSDMFVIDMFIGQVILTKWREAKDDKFRKFMEDEELEYILPHFAVSSLLKQFVDEARKGKIVQVVEDYGASIGGIFYCEAGKESETKKIYPEQPEMIFYFNL